MISSWWNVVIALSLLLLEAVVISELMSLL
jgi:hypothetical protein